MKLLVRNLDRSTTEEELKTLFQASGTVQSCNLVIDQVTGESKGFGFVETPKSGEAKIAVKNLNNKTESKNLILSTKQELQEQDLLSLPGVSKANLVAELHEQRWRLQHTQENNPVDTIAKAVIDKGWTLLEITPEQHSLEQIFVDIISSERTDKHEEEGK